MLRLLAARSLRGLLLRLLVMPWLLGLYMIILGGDQVPLGWALFIGSLVAVGAIGAFFPRR